VRRNAKASSAGPTQRQANGLGRFFRGAGAGRDASLTCAGSGARSGLRTRLVLAAALAALALLLVPAASPAALTHLHIGPLGSAEQPQLGVAEGLAVDQSTGDVLAIAAGGNEQQQFSFTGTWVSETDTFKLENLPASCSASSTGPIAYTTSFAIETNIQTALGEVCGGTSNFAMSGSLEFGLFVEFQGAFAETLEPTMGCTTEVGAGQCSVEATQAGGPGGFYRFKPNGEPAPFSALGTNLIDGSETPQGSLSFPQPVSGPREVQVAVDNTGGPADGYIYVTQLNARLVDVFASDGHYVGQLTEAGGRAFSRACGVGVDGAGNVYVGSRSEVHKFTPSAGAPSTWANPANLATTKVCTVAAGAAASEGSIFVDEIISLFGSGGRTTKLDAGSGATDYVVAESGTTTATLNPATGNVYLASHAEVNEYDASGASEATLASSFSAGGEVLGVAVDETSGNVYIARGGDPNIEVYGPPVPLPDAKTEDASEVGGETALLHGSVSAAGGPGATCEFQYATKAGFESEGFSSAETAPCEPAGPFTGEAENAVTGEATGLTPGTDYRFRLVATSSNGTSYGAVRGLHTPLPALVEAESVEAVGADNADLSAVIVPEGGATTYRVEFGATSAYGQSSETATIGFEGDESPHTVSVHVAGLSPGAAYHFRFVATNGAGTTEGEDTSFATYPTPQSFAPCSNDRFRTGFGAELPDCRAYEQATPTDKNGSDARGTVGQVEASSNGDRVTFNVYSGLPTSGGSSILSAFIASRGPEGWSSDGLLPLTEAGKKATVEGWSEDLSRTLVSTAAGLYLRDSATASFEPELTVGNSGAEAVAFAADTRHLLVQTTVPLLPEFSGYEERLYDLDHGRLSYVGRIPAGAETSCDDEAGPACIVSPTGSYAGYSWEVSPGLQSYALTPASREQISRDGSRVFFTALGENPGETKIYLREDGARTTWASAPQRSAPDPNGTQRATLWAVTPDGSKAFFTSCEKLTENSTAVASSETGCGVENRGGHQYLYGRGLDLYSYDSGSGKLTDLTVDSNAGDALGADVVSVLGASADGSYVYFVANGVLAPGASPGNCQTSSGFGGACNLYVAHRGTVSFLAPLAEGGRGGDEANWARGSEGTSRVSTDGTLLFRSLNSLTGYDNVGSELGDCGVTNQGVSLFISPCPEFYRYVPTTEQLTCVTCNPAGLAPKGDGPSLASTHYSGVNFSVGGAPFLTRNLSANGRRVFFESDDALLPADTNGKSGCPIVDKRANRSCKDVYEWEAKGEGSCESESENGGCLYLISSGKSPDPSFFLDASENGDHVFFFTHQQLVPGDHDQLEDVYDASVGGGQASPHALTPPTCTGSACVANPPPPPPESLSSSTFSGPGNAKAAPRKRRCPKGKRKVRRKGKVRCVARHHRKRHKRHHRRHHKRAAHHRAHHKRANVNRGGSK
jgi:hypothetical protein